MKQNILGGSKCSSGRNNDGATIVRLFDQEVDNTNHNHDSSVNNTISYT